MTAPHHTDLRLKIVTSISQTAPAYTETQNPVKLKLYLNNYIIACYIIYIIYIYILYRVNIIIMLDMLIYL
jgi:hypothetical protein